MCIEYIGYMCIYNEYIAYFRCVYTHMYIYRGYRLYIQYIYTYIYKFNIYTHMSAYCRYIFFLLKVSFQIYSSLS